MIGRILLSLESRADKMKTKYLLSKISHGGGTTLGGNCKINCPENISLGEDTMINDHTMLHASPNSKIQIGNHCMVSYYVCLRTEAHNYFDTSVPMKHQGQQEKDIMIGDDVWIGYGAQIMPGIHIGNGAVIGAGAIVTKNCDAYGVYVGVPARKIKSRK